jgi:hypothetical protein
VYEGLTIVFKLSIATLSTMFVGSWAATGGSKKPVQKSPPIETTDKEEEKFIQYVILHYEHTILWLPFDTGNRN